MTELKLYARAGGLAYDPTRARRTGQVPPYIGREFDAETSSFPALEKPYTIQASGPVLERIKRIVRDQGGAWCADKETAAALGAPFVDVEFRDGQWLEALPKPAAAPAAKGKK